MSMSQPIERMESPAAESGQPLGADELIDQQWLDGLLERVDEQGLQLTGEGGFLPALVKVRCV